MFDFLIVEAGKNRFFLKTPDMPTSVSISESLQSCGIGSETGFISLYDFRSDDLLFEKEAHQSAITSLHFHPVKDCFLSSSDDGKIVIGRAHNLSLKFTIPVHTEAVIYSNWSEDGEMFYSVGNDKIVSSWTLPEHLDFNDFTDSDNEHEEEASEILTSENEVEITETRKKINILYDLRSKLMDLNQIFTKFEERISAL